jgi:hypothetical protein
VGLPPGAPAADDDDVMVLRAGVLLATLLAACLLGTGVAAAAPAPSTVAAATVPAAAAASRVPCKATARACVRLSTNQAWLLRDGEVELGPVRISHGRAGFRTPPGTFRVSFKNEDHVSSIYDLPMPYSVFFNGGIAFHQGSVRVTSHGCVHLTASAARAFFDELDRGDVVQVVA